MQYVTFSCMESVAALGLLLSFVNSGSKTLKRIPSLEIVSLWNSESSLRVIHFVNLLTENMSESNQFAIIF